MTHFKDYHNFTGSRLERFFKTTLFESHHLLLGLNCLEPGQTQSIHAHDGQDKFYFVLEGQGEFTVGQDSELIGSGWVVWAPAGETHGVTNNGQDRLVILVGIAPAPGG
ncbi:MAG TPA: cupin domain-containing protein [Anaerolineales bacterium]|nr:cupin domain-containing protein [Anaerolineales bacterium]